jgi:hypothetical protein
MTAIDASPNDQESQMSTKDGTAPHTTDEVTAEIDRVSLAQALQDVEIANGRVMDLTQRLISANQEVVELRRALDEARVAQGALQRDNEEIRASAGYRIASRLWIVKTALRR